MEPEGSLPQSQYPPPVPIPSQLDPLIQLAYSKYISLYLYVLHSFGTFAASGFGPYSRVVYSLNDSFIGHSTILRLDIQPFEEDHNAVPKRHSPITQWRGDISPPPKKEFTPAEA